MLSTVKGHYHFTPISSSYLIMQKKIEQFSQITWLFMHFLHVLMFLQSNCTRILHPHKNTKRLPLSLPKNREQTLTHNLAHHFYVEGTELKINGP